MITSALESFATSTASRKLSYCVVPIIATVFAATTVTVVVAVLPLLDVAVIVAVPSDTAVTTPSATVATPSSLDDQVTFLLVALVGSNVTTNVSDVPTGSVVASLSTLIALTATLLLPPLPPLPPPLLGGLVTTPDPLSSLVALLLGGTSVPPPAVTPEAPSLLTFVLGVVTAVLSAPSLTVTVFTVPVPETIVLTAEVSTFATRPSTFKVVPEALDPTTTSLTAASLATVILAPPSPVTSIFPTVPFCTTTGTSGAATSTVPIVPSIITSSFPSFITTTSMSAPSSTETRIRPSTLATTTLPSTPPPLIMTEFSPPPRTTRFPLIITFSRVTSPSPTPSPIIKSPLTVTSFNVTSGTFTITLPDATEVTVPAWVIYCFIMLSITTANWALVILAFGASRLSLPLTYPFLTRAPTPGTAQSATWSLSAKADKSSRVPSVILKALANTVKAS